MRKPLLPAPSLRAGKIALAFTIAFNIIGGVLMKESHAFTVLPAVIGFVIAYAITYALFIYVLKCIPMGVAYALWSGIGTVATAIVGVILWNEPMNILIVAGLAAIVVGAVLLNIATVEK